MIRVIDARHVRDYVVWLRFSDDTEGRSTSATSCTARCSNPCGTNGCFARSRCIPSGIQLSGRTRPTSPRSFSTKLRVLG